MTSKDTQLMATIEKYQDTIMKLDNVVAMGVSDKRSEGKSLNRLCIKVFVSRKVPKSELSTYQLIPESLDGFETDVEEMETLKVL